MNLARTLVFCAVAVLTSCGTGQQDVPLQSTTTTIEPDGTVHIPAFAAPYSDLASEAAKKNLVDTNLGFSRWRIAVADLNDKRDIADIRKAFDDVLVRPGLERLRRAFSVTITPERIGDVQTDVVMPVEGIAAKNEERVLINLHGGSVKVGARYAGQEESVPIASLAKIKVITVDYRMGPEHKFPAASEDVAAVYKELLKHYRPQNIGIYGCSAGGWLTAQSTAWIHAQGLPRPGAIGMFGGAGVIGRWGDSWQISGALMGMHLAAVSVKDSVPVYYSNASLDDPMVSPAHSPSVLKEFPPALLIGGTRDMQLSTVVYTHAQLVKVDVDADLHVWEGAPHCSFAVGVVDPDVPETREAWDVIVEFFDKHLGSS